MPITEGDGGSERDGAHYARNWANAQLDAPSVVPGTADGFMVDPERAQECIAEMTRIVAEVRRASYQTNVMDLDPPGWDEVSVNLVRNAAVMAERARAYATTWADQIEATRDGLQAQLDAYRATESANVSGLA